MLIAAILGIIAVATTGAALHQSVQTVHFVQEWHKDSDVLCSTQRQIDGKLAAQMADLQQVVIPSRVYRWRYQTYLANEH